MTILVLGSINADVTCYAPALPRMGETVLGTDYSVDLGGKGANQACAAARLGAAVEFVGRVGADAFGRLAVGKLDAFGVSSRLSVKDDPRPTGVAVITVDATGRNTITVVAGANMHVSEADVARMLAELEHTKVLMLQLEIPLATCLAAARAARERGVRVILDPAPVPPDGLPDELVALVDVITPNETEAERLLGYPPDTPELARRAAVDLVARGAKAAIVTLGGRGAELADGRASAFIAPLPVTPVSTVAAGDCFNAGLAVALAEGATLREAARFGAACGALCTTRAGSAISAPSRAEVERLLGTR